MNRFLKLPRIIRILFVFFTAVAIVLAIFALIDRIYIMYLFDRETIVWPSYVSVGIGAVAYALGYYLFVGTRGTQPSAMRGRWLYMAISIAAVVVSVVLIVQGLSMTDYFAG